MSFRLSEDRIAVLADDAEETSASGLILTEGAQNPFITGTVVQTGPGRRNEAGDRVEMDYHPDDVVIFHRHAGGRWEWEGAEYRMLTPGDILGVTETSLSVVE